MSKLDDLIAEFCPDGVEFVKLGEVLKNNNASNSVSKKDYKETGKLLIIDQSQAYIAAYTDNESAVPPILPCIIFGDHTRIVKYAEQKFAQGDSGTKIFIPNTSSANTKYVYYAFCNLRITSRGYNRHWSIAKDEIIPLPPLPVQQEIVRILDKFTLLEAELEAELTARKKQYEYYRKKLLSFDESVPKMPLGSICIVQSGGTPSKAKHEYWGNGTIKWLGSTVCQNQKTVTEVTNYISEAGLKNSSAKLMKKDTTLIALVGATIGKIAFLSFEAAINQNIAGIYPNDITKLNPSYVFYACGMLYADFVGLSQGKLAMANLSFVRGLKIPVPSLEEQERIVAILDRFDALCNDLTNGLPAEIAARKKQYEYYRDKLLTFKEKLS